MFVLGTAGIGIARETRWSAVRLIMQSEFFMLLMVLTLPFHAFLGLMPSAVIGARRTHRA